MSAEDAALPDTTDDPRAPASRDLERAVAFEAIRSALFTGPRQPIAIGRFQITERVGQGGMGVVYAAYDPQLERKVAIKVVRDLGDGPDEVDRARRSLEREARAAAGLAHPHVVTVYDSGHYGDGFYLAMEFVEGQTLRRWLKQQQRTWSEILPMFIGAGRGLQAAHAAGLAHCDFKPDNVLIGSDERPRVADFGLVRWTESRSEPSMELSPSQTMEGSPGTFQSVIAGTPKYMAPEQRSGLPIGPRSDQFSFCVALYEALFSAFPYSRDGDLPFENPGVLGRAHAKTEVPSAIVRAVLVGLELAPERRHDSMAVLVDRLERAMAALRRRKWWAVGLVAAATTGGVGYAAAEDPIDPCEGAAASIETLWSEPTRAEVREQLLATGSEARADRVGRLLDQYVEQWSAMRQSSCEATHHQGTQSAEVLELRTACLDRRRATLENLVGRLHDGDRALLAEALPLAEGMTPVEECDAEFIRRNRITNAADGRNDLSRSPEADAASRAMYQKLEDARLLLARGDFDPAIEQLRQVEAEAHRTGLRQLESIAIRLRVGYEMGPQNAAASVEQLQSALGLAVESGDYTSAVQSVVLLLRAAGLGADPKLDPAFMLTLGRAWAGKSLRPALNQVELDLAESTLVASTGRWEDALRILDEGAARLESSGQSEHSVTFLLQSLRAQILLDAGQPQPARDLMTELVRRQRDLLGSNHPMVGDSETILGGAHRILGELDLAKEHFLEAQRIYAQSIGTDTPRYAAVSTDLASVYQGLGDYPAAREAFDQGIAIYERLHGPRHASLGIPLNQLAELEYEMGAYSDGLAHATSAVEIARASYGPEHPFTVVFGNTVGKLHLALGDAAAAVTVLAEAHARLAANVQTNPTWVGEAAFFLAKATMRADPSRRADADALSQQAIEHFGRAQGKDPQRLIEEITEWRRLEGLPTPAD